MVLAFHQKPISYTIRYVYGCISNKGHLISKGLCGFFNSPKKRTKNFCPSRLGRKLTFSSSFFGRIEDAKIFFRDQLTFNSLYLINYMHYNIYLHTLSKHVWKNTNTCTSNFLLLLFPLLIVYNATVNTDITYKAF